MTPGDGLSAYLDGIDFVAAVGAAVLAVVVAAVALKLAVILGPILGDLTNDARSILRGKSGPPAPPGLCATCRSFNEPFARFCYRGCGSRTNNDPGN
jgi:hypothetical protein